MTTRWGIVGASRIAARAFIPHARLDQRNLITAIAASNLPRAKAFSAEHNIELAYGSYDELFADKNIDAVYIAQPPIFHPELALQAVNAGKAVLVEKPFGVTSKAVADFLAAAPADHLAWEALVFAFHPQLQIAHQLKSKLGQIRHIYSHFVYTPEEPNDYRKDPSLGGGALLDVGTYPLRAAQAIMNESPKLVSAESIYSDLGANDEGNAFFEYPSGVTFHMHWSNRKERDKSLVIEYEKGSAVFEEPFAPAASDYVLMRDSNGTEKLAAGPVSTWQYALAHIVDVIEDGIKPIHQIKDFSLAHAQLLELIDQTSRG